jgi:outer membrane immunogenic protein
MKRFAWSLVIAYLMACSAHGADLPIPTKAPPPVVYADPWTGGFIGAQLGHAWDTSGQSGLITQANSAMFFDSLTTAPQGLTGGVFVGAGMKCLGILYCGIESDINAAAMHAAGGVSSSGLAQDFAINGDTKQTLFGSTRARLGIILPLNIPLMVYATGGVAYADMSGNVTINNITGATAGGSVGNSSWRTGGAWGFGAELAFAPGWTARAQWIRYDTGDLTTTVPIVNAAGAPTGALGNFKFSGQIDAVTGGIAYHF